MLSEVATSGSNGRRFDVLNATSVSWVVEICHQWQSCSLGYVEIRRILERKTQAILCTLRFEVPTTTSKKPISV